MTQTAPGLDYARHAMLVWRDWALSQHERGWPTASSEVQAQQRAATATVVDGIAAYTGTVDVGTQGKTVPRDPPAMPKETRPARGPRIPDIDRARLGPAVERHLQDLGELIPVVSAVLKVHYLCPELTTADRAKRLGVSGRRYFEHVDRGLVWLSARLTV